MVPSPALMASFPLVCLGHVMQRSYSKEHGVGSRLGAISPGSGEPKRPLLCMLLIVPAKEPYQRDMPYMYNHTCYDATLQHSVAFPVKKHSVGARRAHQLHISLGGWYPGSDIRVA